MKREFGQENGPSDEAVLTNLREWMRGIASGPEFEKATKAELWLLEVDSSNTSGLLPLRIAALTHDLSRAQSSLTSPAYPKPGLNIDNFREWRKLRNQETTAMLDRRLGGIGLSQGLVKRTQLLVQRQEMAFNYPAVLVQAGVSLAFLEVEAPFLVDQAPIGMNGTDTEWLVARMYQRIRIPRALEMAKPFYQEAMKQLAERRRVAQKGYAQSMKRCDNKIGPRYREIQKLRFFADQMIGLGKATLGA